MTGERADGEMVKWCPEQQAGPTLWPATPQTRQRHRLYQQRQLLRLCIQNHWRPRQQSRLPDQVGKTHPHRQTGQQVERTHTPAVRS